MTQRLFFIHNPKTAGTSIKDALKSRFHASEISPFQQSQPHEKWTSEDVQEGYKFFAGHFGFDFALTTENNPTVITVFRHPVGRTVSLYDYLRSMSKDYIQNNFPDGSVAHVANSLRFGEFIRSENKLVNLYLSNPHTRQLYDSMWKPNSTKDRAILDIVKHRISEMPWFGVFEHLDLSFETLRIQFELDDALSLPHSNDTYESPESVDRTVPTADDVSVILEKNTLDLDIYEFSKTLFFANVSTTVRTEHCRRTQLQSEIRAVRENALMQIDRLQNEMRTISESASANNDKLKDQLSACLAAQSALNESLNAIYKSRSWKVARLLRSAARLILRR